MSIYNIDHETDVVTLAAGDKVAVYDADASAIKSATISELVEYGIGLKGGVVNTTASTLTITKALHAGKTVTLNAAAGLTATLPAATGTGNRYTFHVGTKVTSNNDIIKVANTTDVMVGRCFTVTTTATNSEGFTTSATSDTITLNGSTKGGWVGDRVDVIDIATGKFSAMVYTYSTGTEATPFSASV